MAAACPFPGIYYEHTVPISLRAKGFLLVSSSPIIFHWLFCCLFFNFVVYFQMPYLISPLQLFSYFRGVLIFVSFSAVDAVHIFIRLILDEVTLV